MLLLCVSATAFAQTTPMATEAPPVRSATEFVRPDGTLDLSEAPTGALDLSGLNVSIGDDGQLVTMPPGDYTAIGTGPGGSGITRGSVYALAVSSDGSLYAGGDFTRAGGVTVNRIARWTPSTGTWSALGTGVSGAVFALAAASDGSLYAGGNFATAGGVSANFIARWTPGTGTSGTWSALGSGVDDAVSTLAAAPDGSLYAGGSFTTAGGVPVNRIARWTPSTGTWSTLGAGTNASVSEMVVAQDGRLYVVGDFTTAGGVPANSVARWTPGTGTSGTWSALGSGVNDYVYEVALAPDGSLYFGGEFTTAGGVTVSRIARWTPSTGAWSALGSGVNSSVVSLTVAPDGSLYAGGDFTRAGGVTVNRIARWTPSTGTWSALGSGVNGRVYTLAAMPDGSLYAGGDFTLAGGAVTASLALWTPSTGTAGTWSGIGTGNNNPVDNTVNALVVAPDRSVYVGGAFTTAGGAIGTSRVARWTPSTGTSGTWSALGTGVFPGDVRALAVAPDGSLYAGGSFTSAGGVTVSRIARWTPSTGTWSALGSGVSGAVFALAAAPDGSLYAGGRFTSAGGVTVNRIARWTPSTGTWSALGSGVSPGDVRALAVAPDSSVYAGGSFTSAGGAGARFIARWTPSTGTSGTWSALGGAITSSFVFALAVAPDGSLYVGGAFASAGGVAGTAYLAQWTPGTGTSGTWSALGSGVDGAVLALATTSGGDLVLGGDFTTAGGAPALYLALYDAPVRGRIDGPQAWHALSAPAGGLTLDDLLGPLWTQGFPGADYAGGQANVLGYDEPAPGYVVPTSQNDAWTLGTGRFVFVYQDDVYGTPGTFPKRLEVGGSPQIGDFAFPLSYTASGSAASDGWNLLGNPFATAFDWDAVVVGAGVDAAAYIYDPAYLGGTFRTRVGGMGSLANGLMAPMQGFFVHATATGASLTAPAASQVLTGGGASLYRQAVAGLLRVELREGGQPGAEAFVSVRADGALSVDAMDAYALDPLRTNFLRLATEPAAGEPVRLATQTLPSDAAGVVCIPLAAEAIGAPSGTRSLEVAWDAAELPSGWTAVLEDTQTGEQRSLTTAGSYAFETSAEVSAQGSDDGVVLPSLALSRGDAESRVAPTRFAVLLTPSGVVSGEGSRVAEVSLELAPNPTAGAATAWVTGAGTATVSLYDALGRRVGVAFDGEVSGRTAVALPPGLAPGVYVVRVAAGDAVRTARLVVTR